MLVTLPIFNDRPPSVMIADDDGTILNLLAEGFEMFGCRVFTAENGLDAWDLFENRTIDIVLTDIRMPGIDGVQLSHRIRKRSPWVTIGVMTGGDADAATRLLEDGTVDHFFPKPFNLIDDCRSLTTEAQTA